MGLQLQVIEVTDRQQTLSGYYPHSGRRFTPVRKIFCRTAAKNAHQCVGSLHSVPFLRRSPDLDPATCPPGSFGIEVWGFALEPRYQIAAKATAPRSIVPSATAASAGAPGRAGDSARARISSAWRSLAVANHNTTATTTPTITAAHGAMERTTSKPATRPASPVRCQAKRVRSGWRPGSKSSLTLAARPPESSGQ